MIAVIGTGYVGLITGVCLALWGHDVTCIDIDSNKIQRLRTGQPTIFEAGLPEKLSLCINSGRLRFSDTHVLPAETDVVYIAVGTPSDEDGKADLRHVHTAVLEMLRQERRPEVLVMKSTVPPGTGRWIQESLLQNTGISYVANPEFLREGQALHDGLNPERIVLGGEPGAVGRIKQLYQYVDAPVVQTDITSAELIKYASNNLLALRISFINEIANLCDAVGANVEEVAHGLGLDSRIGPAFLRPGIGFGGSCFPKDVAALENIAARLGVTSHTWSAARKVNEEQRLLPVVRLSKALGGLQGKKVGVLGLAFKPGTDDTREAPTLYFASRLVELGADVVIYDPCAETVIVPDVRRVGTLVECVQGAHAVIVATEWPEFTQATWDDLFKLMLAPHLVFDGRNCLNPERMRSIGFHYECVGKPLVMLQEKPAERV